METVYIFGAILVFTAIAICWTLLRNRTRTRQMSRAAESLGFSFEPDGAAWTARGLPDTPLFAFASIGVHNSISNVMSGAIGGHAVTLCDYSYWTGSTASTRFDYSQTVACFPLKRELPAFTLLPRDHPVDEHAAAFALKAAGVLAGAGKTMVGSSDRWEAVQRMISEAQAQGIEVASHPKFSERYKLVGPGRESVKHLFSAAPIEYFERQDRAAVTVECSGKWLAVYRRKTRVKPEDVPAFLNQAAELLKLLGL